MKILIFTWRDIKNPLAGGAEVVVHEISRRWVKWGHKVTVCTSRFKKSSNEEVIDGVKIVRMGNSFTVYFHARRYYKKYLKGKYDVAIEEIHGLRPFYCYYYVKEPVIALLHQNGRNFDEFNLKNSVAYYEFPPIINLGVYIIEPYILRYFNKLPLFVMSESTKKDYLDLQHSPDNIYVIPEGINIEPIEKLTKKENDPRFMYAGRVKRPKRVEHIIKALNQVRSEYPSVKLWIVGRGPDSYIKYLKKVSKELNFENNLKFFGYLPEAKKNRLFQKSHALIMTSIREGWGLVVTEANAMGTPAIGYDVPGLRDSIINGKTGILVENENIDDLGKAIIKFIKDKKFQNRLAKNAWEWSKEFNWDRSAKVALKRIKDVLAENNQKM